MKKIFTIALLIIVAIIGISTILFDENINKKYKLCEGKLTIKIPAIYTRISENNQDGEISLYNSENGITINVGMLEESFWTSTKLEERIDEYMKIISSANYDAEIRNVKTEILEENNGNVAKIQVDLVKQTSDRKTITLITSNVEPNMIIEITGTKDSIEDNVEEIEQIIASVKVKQ